MRLVSLCLLFVPAVAFGESEIGRHQCDLLIAKAEAGISCMIPNFDTKKCEGNYSAAFEKRQSNLPYPIADYNKVSFNKESLTTAFNSPSEMITDPFKKNGARQGAVDVGSFALDIGLMI